MVGQAEAVLRDVRDAARSLTRMPLFTTTVILCFAIGVGVNAMMFGLVNALLFRAPPGVQDANRVFRLHLKYVAPGAPQFPELGDGNLTAFDYDALQAGARTLDVAAYATHEMTIGHGAGARAVSVMFVTPSYFHLLGVRPALGRFLAHDENGISTGAVAVLSYGLWQERFGGVSGVLGRTVRVGTGAYTIVGVAPEGFRGTDLKRVGLWLPSGAALHEIYHNDVTDFRVAQWLHTIVRPRPGVSEAQARADASRTFQVAYASRFAPGFRGVMVATLDPIIAGYGNELTKDDQVSLWLAGMSIIVLLIAIANIANLLMARAATRGRDVAIRVALGISRARLWQQLLTESLLLAVVGGALGLTIAWLGSRGLALYAFPALRAAGGIVDVRILAFAALTAGLTALLSVVAPLRYGMRADQPLMGAPPDGGRARSRLRVGLLVGQVALTTVLLVGGGLFARSLSALRSLDLGMDVDHLVVGRVALAQAGYPEGEAQAIMRRMADRVRELPGVREVSLASTAPFLGSFSWPDFLIPGRDIPSPGEGPLPLLYINDVSPGFFRTVGTPVIRGRTFTTEDERSGRPVGVINEAMAEALWPGGSAIGKCIHVGEPRMPASTAPCSEIVGVVQGTHLESLRERPRWQYFAPLATGSLSLTPVLLVRTHGDPRALVRTIRRTMQTSGPDLPYADVRTMAQVIEPQLRPWRLATTMFALFAGIALALALSGLYGAFSYMVERRRPEMGVRIALGARPAHIVRLVVGEGARASLIGIGVGLLGAVVLGHTLGALLVGVSWADMSLLTGTSVLVLVTAVLATYLPARRASRVDPTVLLHTE